MTELRGPPHGEKATRSSAAVSDAADPRQSFARVVSTVPLLQAGLERSAVEAGFQLAATSDRADVHVQDAEHPLGNEGIVILTTGQSATVRVTRPPDAATWERIGALLRVLIADLDREGDAGTS